MAPPIRSYLRGRPDTARCVVQLVTSDEGDADGSGCLLEEPAQV